MPKRVWVLRYHWLWVELPSFLLLVYKPEWVSVPEGGWGCGVMSREPHWVPQVGTNRVRLCLGDCHKVPLLLPKAGEGRGAGPLGRLLLCHHSIFSESAFLLSFSSQVRVKGLGGCRAWTLLTAKGGVMWWWRGPGRGPSVGPGRLGKSQGLMLSLAGLWRY